MPEVTDLQRAFPSEFPELSQVILSALYEPREVDRQLNIAEIATSHSHVGITYGFMGDNQIMVQARRDNLSFTYFVCNAPKEYYGIPAKAYNFRISSEPSQAK